MPLSGGETCVGSDPAVQIPVRAGLGLLPRHFAIAPLEDGWHLGAYEGAAVWVNGQLVQVTALRDGDRIVAGQLELTYRDKSEMGMVEPMPEPSLVPLSLPLLQMGTAARRGGGEAVPLPLIYGDEAVEGEPMRLSALMPTKMANDSSGSSRRWGFGTMILIGALLAVVGGLACYVAMFELPAPLKQADLVITDAHILKVTRHTVRKGLSWTELDLDPPMNRVIELPDDLPANPAWGGSMARLGFVKKVYDDTQLNELGKLVALRVVTLELDGKPYRSLAKHNTVQNSENQIITLAGPCLLLGGLGLLMMAWEKWKMKRGGRSPGTGGAVLLPGESFQPEAQDL